MALRYADDFGTDTKYKLLEIPKELADEIDGGAELAFKGQDSDAMVLCTDTTTYTVKVAATSNTMYMTDADTAGAAKVAFGEGDDITVTGAVSSVLELAPCAPRLERLVAALRASPFAGLIGRDEATVTGVTWDAMVDDIQASKQEIRARLRQLHAFEYEGRWHVLDERYAADKLTLILTSAVAEDWALDSLSVPTVTASLEGHDAPEVVVRALLGEYGRPAAGGEGVGEGGQAEVYALDNDRVCRFEAVKLLKECARWPMDSFLEQWAEAVPDGMTTDFAQLQGVALATDTGVEGGSKEVVYFPASALPVDTKKRMEELFKFRPVWSAADISPYLADVAVGGLTVEKILFKHARAYNAKDGSRLYNKR